jgi:DNA replication protein DnaC
MAEIEERERRAVIRRINEAHFPVVKTLEEFDFQSAPHISAAQLRRLSEGVYLERKEPVVLLGETGTGKVTWRLLWRWLPASNASGCASPLRPNW